MAEMESWEKTMQDVECGITQYTSQKFPQINLWAQDSGPIGQGSRYEG